MYVDYYLRDKAEMIYESLAWSLEFQAATFYSMNAWSSFKLKLHSSQTYTSRLYYARRIALLPSPCLPLVLVV